MSTTETTLETSEGTGLLPGRRPEAVEVRRNAGLAALIGVAAAGLAIAYLARAVRTAAVLDWALVAVMAVLAVVWLRTFVDARTPLLVADAQGIRLRLGRTWRGVPWTEVRDVLLRPRSGLLRDGRLTVEPYDDDRVLADLDPAGRRQARWTTRLYGAPLTVPLGLTTRVVGADLGPDRDLGAVLRDLAGAGVPVVELVDPAESAHLDAPDPAESAHLDAPDPEAASSSADSAGETRRRHDPRPRIAAVIGAVAARVHLPHRSLDQAPVDGAEELEPVEDVEGSVDDSDTIDDTAERPAVPAAEVQDEIAADEVPGDEFPGDEVQVDTTLDDGQVVEAPDDAEPTVAVSTRPRPVRDLRIGRRREVTSGLSPRVPRPEPEPQPVEDEHRTETVAVVEELPVRPVADPVVGPQLAAARRRLALGVDQLAERTRIRPHVIEAIEVDDFGPCGGDFYARGHLRTLARVLGVEAAPLLVDYDDRYADAPIDPRRVFEAELASAHQRRSKAGPNWTLLVGAVMALVLAWSVARLFLDQPTETRGEAPVFRAAATPKPATLIGEPVSVGVTASRPVHVTVRNAEGRVVFTADLVAGQSRSVRVVPPVKVTASHGDAVTVGVAGEDRGPVGDTIRQASRRFQVS